MRGSEGILMTTIDHALTSKPALMELPASLVDLASVGFESIPGPWAPLYKLISNVIWSLLGLVGTGWLLTMGLPASKNIGLLFLAPLALVFGLVGSYRSLRVLRAYRRAKKDGVVTMGADTKVAPHGGRLRFLWRISYTYVDHLGRQQRGSREYIRSNEAHSWIGKSGKVLFSPG
jgi:hypothetical protein